MKHFRLLFCRTLLTILALTSGSCEDSLLNERSGGGNRRPLDEAVPDSDWNYVYPEIIKTEFIPSFSDFDHTKCLAWRIIWPEYPVAADADKIPTVFSFEKETLNSLEFLNNTSPQNTYDGIFSLFYNFRLQAVNAMWTELIWSFPGFENIDGVVFAESTMELDEIIYLVTERPSLFKTYWPKLGGAALDQFDYSEGDFFQFQLSPSETYGGIRIVSMTPRIIEVYLAVPND